MYKIRLPRDKCGTGVWCGEAQFNACAALRGLRTHPKVVNLLKGCEAARAEVNILAAVASFFAVGVTLARPYVREVPAQVVLEAGDTGARCAILGVTELAAVTVLRAVFVALAPAVILVVAPVFAALVAAPLVVGAAVAVVRAVSVAIAVGAGGGGFPLAGVDALRADLALLVIVWTAVAVLGARGVALAVPLRVVSGATSDIDAVGGAQFFVVGRVRVHLTDTLVAVSPARGPVEAGNGSIFGLAGAVVGLFVIGMAALSIASVHERGDGRNLDIHFGGDVSVKDKD